MVKLSSQNSIFFDKFFNNFSRLQLEGGTVAEVGQRMCVHNEPDFVPPEY